MADKSGWRKKIHIPRPKTPAAAARPSIGIEDGDDRRLHPGVDMAAWRKTIQHASRPSTPAQQPPTSARDDGSDKCSDHGSEASTPRRLSAPKLKRYMSSYLNLASLSKPADFSTGLWLEEPAFENKVDVDSVWSAVHAHLCRMPSGSLPVAHNSGISCLLEDYRKTREEKNGLDDLLKRVFADWNSAQENWTAAEANFHTELKRLKDMNVRGDPGKVATSQSRTEYLPKREKADGIKAPVLFNRPDDFIAPEQLDALIMKQSKRGKLGDLPTQTTCAHRHSVSAPACFSFSPDGGPIYGTRWRRGCHGWATAAAESRNIICAPGHEYAGFDQRGPTFPRRSF